MITRIFRIAGVLCALSLTTGCLKDVSHNSKPESDKDYFDFKIEQRTALVVDYCFPNKDYVVMVEVYDQNPLIEQDGEYVKKDIEPLYRAATDKAGKLAASIQISSALTKVWLYSDYPGTLSPVELEIKDNMISFNQNAYIAQRSKAALASRAATGNNHTYPDGWLTLGDWDEYGTPDYLDAKRTMPPAGTLYNINEVFVKYNGAKLMSRYPDFFAAGLSSDIHVIKPTKIYLVFINSTAAWSNTVGYFTYPTGQQPQKSSDIQRVLAFPNASPYLKKVNEVPVRGALVSGDRVQLKYWNGTQFVDEFPAGVSIGWWLEGRGFENSNLVIQSKGKYARFSIDSFNEDNNRRTVALRDSKSNRIVAIGFEDNIDLRYNDATFYLEIEENGAIDGNIPEMPEVGGGPAEEENYVKTDGFLMFEDMWPRGADYDMNDVMIKYSTKVYKHILNNLVYKIETEYTPFHKGGILMSGFGIQLSDVPGVVRKVTIDGAAPSRYMEGQMLEPGQTKPTVILFDNLSQVLDKKITMTAEINDAPESSVASPYNPFIFTDSHKTRGQEVHLVKNLPTDKANAALFGTGDDGSDPAAGLYYVLRKKDKQYPFALNMPFMKDIPVPTEGENIDITYPKFRNWVESGGTSDRDWYLHPAKQ